MIDLFCNQQQKALLGLKHFAIEQVYYVFHAQISPYLLTIL